MGDVHYRTRMNSSDALIWDIEADHRLRSTVMVVWQLDGAPDPERMSANVERMIAAIPRLRQRVVEGRGRPSWVETVVDAGRHVTWDSLPAGSSFRDAVVLAERWVVEPFDRDAPLWGLRIVDGLPDGRAAAIIKIHHAIADGLGMVMMLAAFTDLERDPAPAPPSTNVVELPVRRPAWSRTQRVAARARRAATSFADRPVGAVTETARTLRSSVRLVTPHRTPRSTVMTGRSGVVRFDTRVLPLADVKATGRLQDGTVNDVFVAVVADALRRYHDRCGVTCDDLRVHMPVNSRTARTATVAGNEWVPARLVLRIDRDDTVRSVHEQLERLRAEPALHHIGAVSAAVQRLGRPISRWIVGGMMLGVDVLASNVPGPPIPIYLAGTKVERFAAFGPPAGAAINLTAFSYDGEFHIGIASDTAAVADRRLLLDCINAALAAIVTESPVAAAV